MRSKAVDEFRPAVGVAGVIHGVDADEDVVRAEHLAPGERQREEHRVARRHVGDRDAGGRRLRHGDASVGERRTAERREIDVHHPVLDGAERGCATRASAASSASWRWP